MAYEQGNYAAARTYFQASLNLSKELGYCSGVATSLNNLGHVAYAQGDYATARTFFQDNLALNKELGHRSGIATTLMNLGSVAEKDGSGDLDAALKYFEQAQQLATSPNVNNSVLGKALWGSGRVAAKREMKTEARQYLDQAIQIFQQMGDPVLQEAQRFRDSLRSAPDPVQCRKTCEDLQAKGKLAASISECVSKLCADLRRNSIRQSVFPPPMAHNFVPTGRSTCCGPAVTRCEVTVIRC